MADLTSLAVQATNLRAGVAAPGTDVKAQDRGPAVVVSPTLAEAAAATPQPQDDGASAGEDLGGRGNAGEGLRVLAEATAGMLVEEALSIARLRKTLQLYADTGQLFSVQPNGDFLINPEDVGGVDVFIKDIQRRIDKNIEVRPGLEAGAERTRASYSAYMERVRAHFG